MIQYDDGVGTFIALLLMLVVLPWANEKLTDRHVSKLITNILPSLIITRGARKRKV